MADNFVTYGNWHHACVVDEEKPDWCTSASTKEVLYISRPDTTFWHEAGNLCVTLCAGLGMAVLGVWAAKGIVKIFRHCVTSVLESSSLKVRVDNLETKRRK
jgi:hypothetical protein